MRHPALVRHRADLVVGSALVGFLVLMLLLPHTLGVLLLGWGL